MSIEEKLYELIVEIEKETGVRDGLTKIAFDRKVFDHIIFSLHEKRKYPGIISVNTIAEGGLRIFGIPVVARPKEVF